MALAAGLLVGPSPAAAGKRDADTFKQLVIALGYTPTILRENPGGIRIGLIYRPDDADSQEEVDDILKRGDPGPVKGVAVHVDKVGWQNPTALGKAVKNMNLSVLYLCRDLGDALGPILDQARAHKLVVMSSRLADVKAGAVLGVVHEDGHPHIAINTRAAEQAGVTFETRLLRLARIFNSIQAPPTRPAGPLYVPANELQKRRTAGEDPEYPRMARVSGLSGEVTVKLVVDPSGKVSQAKVLKGHEVFHQAVLDAVSGWQFEPTLKDGRPVAVMTVYKFKFDKR